ncbi:MAG: hypothetical protein V1753_12335 [Pseudomonadota bacterium]
MKQCFSCKTELPADIRPGRRDECPSCKRDLHVCLNCKFYDPGSYNDCREPIADPVIEKEQSNFCSFFQFKDMESNDKATQGKHTALDALNRLFGCM